MKKLKPFVVFSDTRDIFFGYAEKPAATMNLKKARRVYYFAARTDGLGGPDALATHGPASGSKIGPECEITVMRVANCTAATLAAAKNFGGSLWLK